MIEMKPFTFVDLAESPISQNLSVKVAGDVRSGPFDADESAEPQPVKLYTADELERAVEEAREAAARQVETELRLAIAEDLEQRRCDMLESISKELQAQRSKVDAELERTWSSSHQLMITLARSLVPKAIERFPLADLTDFLKVTLGRLSPEPSLELRLSPDLVDDGAALVADLGNEVGYDGSIQTVADPALDKGDVQLRWKGGMADRRLKDLETEALHLLDHWLEQPEEPALQDISTTQLSSEKAEASMKGEPLCGMDNTETEMSETGHER